MKAISNESWSMEQKKAFNKLKFILSYGQCIRKWGKQKQKSKHRQLILQEWLQTEQTYILDLQIIQRDIQQPLLKANLMTQEQGKIIFTNIKAMVELSHNLYQCVHKFISTWNPHTTIIGQKLIYFHKFFMIYREYCNNFMKALQILKVIKEKPESQKIFSKLNLDLESYTIKPVQRPPKYQLFLKQYYKSLPHSHIDYNFVGEAILKYQDVNDMNNKSMDRRIRSDTMIKLQTKYGGIVSNTTGRQYYQDFSCICINFTCRVYAFNDMLLFVKKNSSNHDQIYKRLNLNQTSHILKKTHLKYYKNMIFICGADNSVHLTFALEADSSFFYNYVQQILSDLTQKHHQKMERLNQCESKKKSLAKLKISSWYQNDSYNVIYNPKLQIIVQGLAKPKNQELFSIRFHIVPPSNISQLILVSFNDILKIHTYLTIQYKQVAFPKVQLKPEHFSVFQANKYKSKLVEYHSFMIEQFLNFIYRSQILYKQWKNISKQIGLHDAFYEYAATQQFSCNCERCMQLAKGQSIQYYQLLLKHAKTTNLAKQRFSQQDLPRERRSWKKSYFSQQFNQVVINKPVCSIYAIRIIEQIKNTSKSNTSNFDRKMLRLKAQMGDFNCGFLENINKPLPQIITLKIQLLAADQVTIQVTLKQDRCVREIIDKFGENNSINVYDWGLFVQDQDKMIHIGNDQKIMDFARKWEVQLEKLEAKKDDYFMLIKRWSGYLAGNRKAKLFLKKYMYFESELQISLCKANQQRAYFVINEQFGRIKNGELQLNNSQLISICSFYMIIHQLENIKHLMDQISIEPIKNLLPQKLWCYIVNPHFKNLLIEQILKNFFVLARLNPQENCLMIIFIKILQILNQSRQWIYQYFPVTDKKINDKTDKQYLLGVNHQNFTVLKAVDRKKILSVELSKLKYKITTFSIFIQQAGIQYRFEGKYLWKVKELIEAYQAYNKVSLKIDKI